MGEDKVYKHLSNEKLQNTPFEDCVDAFLMDIRSHLLEGEFVDGYQTLMRMACDISLIYAIINEVPLEGLVNEYCEILKERVNLAKVRISEETIDEIASSAGIFNKEIIN